MHTATIATSSAEVHFRLADEVFALPSRDVLGELAAVTVRRVPGAHPWFDGVIAWDGRILPALNGRRRLGLPEAPATPPLGALIVRWQDGAFALLVDAHGAEGAPALAAAAPALLSAAALLGEAPLACPFVSADTIED